jgi:hypothetical protein
MIEEDIKEVREEDMDEEEEEDMVVVEEDHLFSLIVEKWATCHDSVPNMHSVGTVTVQSMSQKISQICWKSGKKRRCIAIW